MLPIYKMRRPKTIPLNPMSPLIDGDIYVGHTTTVPSVPGRVALPAIEQATLSHRDDYYFFIIQESGHTVLEVDFQQYSIKGQAVLCIHPGQVHRIISFKNVVAGFLAIRQESIQALYLEALQHILPAQPLQLQKKRDALLTTTLSLCTELFQRRQEKLYEAVLKDSCNTFIGLVCSRYLAQAVPAGRLSRSGVITQSFKTMLEKRFLSLKRPSEYAAQLHITTAYLNECVKNTTGYSVSHHIRERIILEARRMLYHSDLSAKEIAAALGYDDYPYFSRIFSSATGRSVQAFRSQNRD